MGIGKDLTKEITAWGTLGIIIVVISVILLKFKDVTGVTSGLNTTIDTFVTAFSEPKNWVIIVIISLIGFAIVKIYQSKKM